MKNTRGYDVRRVIGLPEDDDRVDVKIGDIGDVASEETLGSILQKLVDVITDNDEIRAKIVGDVTIESVEVDRVQLIDANGNKLVFTEDGEINFIAADGKIATLGTTTDEATAETVIGLLKSLKAKDYATETKLEAVRDLLETISGLDFSTETTLQSVETLMDTISKLDFATETTLEAARALLEAIKGTDGIKKIVDKVDTKVADGDNVALGATTDADTVTTVIGLLKKLQSILEAGIGVTESSPLTSIAATVADGDDVALGSTSDTDSDTTVIGRLQKLITDLAALADSKKLSDIVTSLGYLSGISAAGAVGTLTATTTATAAIAGVSALAGRKGLEILNNSANIVYWGYSNSVTTADGIPINPGIAKQFQFNPSVATPIYVIAGSDSDLYIHEWK
jgi:hypothetical protein